MARELLVVIGLLLVLFEYNSLVRILAIDTSTQAGGVAALEDDRVLQHFFERSARPFSSRLFESLDFLLRDVHFKISDFDLYAVSAGPGSFTGLRIGLTAVKGWSELFGKPIAPVSALHALAAQGNSQHQLIASVMDARRGQVFGGIYRRDGESLDLAIEEVVARPGEFVEEVVRFAGSAPVSFVTPSLDLITSSIENSALRGSSIDTVSEDLAPWIGKIGRQLFLSGDVVDSLSLDANYVRRSDAESYWKES
jgi:tRNA threonylcarbamoyladenosine biosynthesis protein TsaB